VQWQTDLLKTLGRNVRKFRHEHGLSQGALGEKAGLHRTYISSLERGSRNVSMGSLAAIARAMDLSISKLCEGIDKPQAG
jgi:transcriptional regulator with XRE-family HTH domain